MQACWCNHPVQAHLVSNAKASRQSQTSLMSSQQKTKKPNSKVCLLPVRSGRSTATRLSKRPGLSRAGSSTSALLVAAMQITILSLSDSNPSSSVSSWLRVCSRSSLPTLLSRVSLPVVPSENRHWSYPKNAADESYYFCHFAHPNCKMMMSVPCVVGEIAML